jgi:peroxiredoxin
MARSLRTVAFAAVVALNGCATTSATHGLPDFSLPDTTGEIVQLSSLTGKQLIYLDFWATWCGPCGAEMPQLQRLYDTYKARGFVIVAVSMDDPSTQGSVASYVHRNGLSFPVVIDTDNRATSLYNPTRSAPYGVLIDRTGKIADEHAGYTPGDEVALENKIRELL